LEQRIPERLPVVVAVDVDPARGHEEPVGGKHSSPGTNIRADLDDATVVDRDVGRSRRRPGPVDDRASADHEVVHPCSPLAVCRRAAARSWSTYATQLLRGTTMRRSIHGPIAPAEPPSGR